MAPMWQGQDGGSAVTGIALQVAGKMTFCPLWISCQDYGSLHAGKMLRCPAMG